MPRLKAQSPSEESLEGHKARRRVVKACQRCRLRKCKCDGSSPCTRCKADDAICAYGKHEKSDKIVFRKGYVQMLERQHTQLIAGLQELYRRIQSGESFPTSSALEPAHYGQPLTHKILEAIGVLQGDEWDDNNGEGIENDPLWQNFDIHQSNSQDYASMYNDSHTNSPATQTTFSPILATQATFPHSIIMAKRRSKLQDANGGRMTSEALSTPPLFNTNLPPYHPGHVQSSTFQMPLPLSTFSHDNGDSGFGHMNWASFSVDELFANPNVPPLQVAS